MPIPSLVPGIKTLLAREHDPQAADADHAYAQKRLTILKRDRYRCVACGFPAPPERTAQSGSLAASGYLEVHHVDNDHRNNENDHNLISLCPFCHSVHHIGFGGAHKRITLAVIPWLTQEQVNLLCNLCGVAMARREKGQGERLARRAEQLYRTMQQMSSPMEELFGCSDVSVLSGALSILHRSSPALYVERGRALWPVRVIPTLAAFNEAVDWWSTRTWLSGENWEAAWENLLEQQR